MKYALIIGNNKYDDPKLAQLKTPAADSQVLEASLNLGSFSSGYYTLSINGNLIGEFDS